MHEEMKKRLNSGNASHHSVQNLLPSRLLSKNAKVKKSIVILPFVLDGFEIWSVTLREAYRLRMFENRVLRKTYGPKRKEINSYGNTE
jgi:hypothetical protein